MKQINVIIISLLVFGLWSNAQTKLTNDTLISLVLKNDTDTKSNYRVLLIYQNDSSRRYLQLKRNSKLITSIPLPIADEEVKNFAIDKVTAIKNGFRLTVSWGEWYNFNNREFDFIFRNNQYLLEVIKIKIHTYEPEKETVKKRCLTHPIPIQKFSIIQYIEEEKL